MNNPTIDDVKSLLGNQATSAPDPYHFIYGYWPNPKLPEDPEHGKPAWYINRGWCKCPIDKDHLGRHGDAFEVKDAIPSDNSPS